MNGNCGWHVAFVCTCMAFRLWSNYVRPRSRHIPSLRRTRVVISIEKVIESISVGTGYRLGCLISSVAVVIYLRFLSCVNIILQTLFIITCNYLVQTGPDASGT